MRDSSVKWAPCLSLFPQNITWDFVVCIEHELSPVNLQIWCLALLSLQKIPNYLEEIVSQSPRTRDYREKQTNTESNEQPDPFYKHKRKSLTLSDCICPKHTYSGTLGMAHIEELLLSTFLQD